MKFIATNDLCEMQTHNSSRSETFRARTPDVGVIILMLMLMLTLVMSICSLRLQECLKLQRSTFVNGIEMTSCMSKPL